MQHPAYIRRRFFSRLPFFPLNHTIDFHVQLAILTTRNSTMKFTTAIITSLLATSAVAFDKWQRKSLITHTSRCFQTDIVNSMGQARLRLRERLSGHS
jgi:hypothetical protein